MIKISHELPKQLFGIHNLINDYPYALGHLFSDKEYSDFYKKKFKTSDYSILDNGTFELGKSIDSETLFNLIEDYKPTHFMLPDKLYSYQETLDMSTEFLTKYKGKLRATPVGVIQGKDFQELEFCLDTYSKLGCRIIAIPYDCTPNDEPGIVRFQFIRKVFKRWNKSNFNQVTLHLLGCKNPVEFTLYDEEDKKYFLSVDTSSPVIAGWNGIKYGEYGYFKDKPKEKLAENLDIKLSETQLDDIIFNVKKFKEYWK